MCSTFFCETKTSIISACVMADSTSREIETRLLKKKKHPQPPGSQTAESQSLRCFLCESCNDFESPAAVASPPRSPPGSAGLFEPASQPGNSLILFQTSDVLHGGRGIVVLLQSLKTKTFVSMAITDKLLRGDFHHHHHSSLCFNLQFLDA